MSIILACRNMGELRLNDFKFNPDSETTKIYVIPKGSRKRTKLNATREKQCVAPGAEKSTGQDMKL